ncbi:MAG: hypothetical protein Q4B52_07605, partial [Tissierellia bacterium]|nr:hypothetical protein [Tissierellia bacterium]
GASMKILKSYLKERFIIALIIISAVLSILAIKTVYNKRDDMAYYNYMERYNDMYTSLQSQAELGMVKKNSMDYKAKLWHAQSMKKMAEYYKESGRKNWQKINDLEFMQILYLVEFGEDVDVDNSFYNKNKKDIEKYYNLEDEDIDFSKLRAYYLKNPAQKDETFLERIPTWKLSLKYYLNSKKNNRDVLSVQNPSAYNYLFENYSESIYKNILIVFMILVGAFLVNNSKKTKSYDLLGEVSSKKEIFYHYIKYAFLISMIIIFLTDLISFLYMGFKEGFFGFSSNMLIYKKGLYTPKTYDNIYEVATYLGLSKLMATDVLYATNNSFVFNTFNDLSMIKMPLFLALSFLVETLKIFVFSTMGVVFALLLKNKGYVISMLAVIFGIISNFLMSFQKSFNFFSYPTGWNVVLGYTHVSFLSCFIILIIFSLLFTLLGRRLFNRREVL